ncbi:MAG: GNAT family N-acetyltransferase [Campylobacterales bacterium]|nr:GNAT family N-acetyltransferase [Campylobacterales bacterium]
MTIRQANYNDISAMAQLLSELFTIEDDFVIDTNKQICGLQLLLQHSDTIVLVAETSEHLIGMVSMQPLISTAMGEWVGLIEDMIVTSDFRRMGIGKLLLGAMIEESKRLGYGRLALGADIRNESAIAFYRTFGFETSNMGLMYFTS